METSKTKIMSLVWVNLLLFLKQPVFGEKLSFLNNKSSQDSWQCLPFYVAMNKKDPAEVLLILQKKSDKEPVKKW